MSESGEQILTRVSAVIACLAYDAVASGRDADPRDPMDEVFDRQDFENQVHRILRDECTELWEVVAGEAEAARVRDLLRRLFEKLPHTRHDLSTGRCAGCGAVQWCGDGKGADPHKPGCVVVEARRELSP
jgi:hypothetical protein